MAQPNHAPDSSAPLHGTIMLRPRTVRWSAYAIAVLVMGAAIVMAVLIPGFSLGNRLGFPLFGLLIAVFCHMEASVRAEARPDVLIVRNLVRTHELQWAQVIGVSFPAGDPWAHLDLSDGRTLSVMALQRTDGARGLAQARTLAQLIRERGEAHDGE